MTAKPRPSIGKRNREQARRDRQQAKTARRTDRATQRRQRSETPLGEDPDLAGIVPGPQPDEADGTD